MSSVSGMIRTMAAVPYVHLANPAKNAEEIAALEENTVAGLEVCIGNFLKRFPGLFGAQAVVFIAAIVGNIVGGAADGQPVGGMENGAFLFVAQGVEVLQDVIGFLHEIRLRFSGQAA